jgi:hypothetical protein
MYPVLECLEGAAARTLHWPSGRATVSEHGGTRTVTPNAMHAGLIGVLCCIALSQAATHAPSENGAVTAEFNLARVIHETAGGGGSRGYYQPYWAIDYPLAEQHFLTALRRLTTLSVVTDSVHLRLSDERIFDYPFLFLQQPGKGWHPSDQEAANLREHLLRGGFLLVDDFHGEYEWGVFHAAMREVFPNRPIVDIPPNDPVLNLIFSTDYHTNLPGRRHLYVNSGGQAVVTMEGPPRWRGVYDDDGRVMIAINFNSDMGDAWEHEDDPVYPLHMTALAYRLAVNYIAYAMTH